MKLQNFAVSDKIYWYSHSSLNMNKLEYGILDSIKPYQSYLGMPQSFNLSRINNDFNFEVVRAR